jgi:hypothetical protein
MRTTGVKGGSNPAHPSNPNLRALYASICPHILDHCPYRRGPRASRGGGRIRLDCSRLVRDFPGTFYRIARFSWRASTTRLAQNPNLRSADYADYTAQRSRKPCGRRNNREWTRMRDNYSCQFASTRFRPLGCEFACKLGESGACRTVAREERAGESSKMALTK